jgi:hypothetical protein
MDTDRREKRLVFDPNSLIPLRISLAAALQQEHPLVGLQQRFDRGNTP